MTNEETITCWACDKSIPKSSLVCPLCDMPLTDSSEEIDDIDSLLDDLQNQTSGTNDELPDIPSFGDETSLTESNEEEMPEIPSFGDETSSADGDMPNIPEFNLETAEETLDTNQDTPTIPSFDDDIPIIPDFASELIDNDQTIDTAKSEIVSDEISEPKIIDFGDEEFPKIPSFDDQDSIPIEDEAEESEILKGETLNLSKLSITQQFRIFIPQLTYWSLVFVIISIAGVKIDNSNFDLVTFNPDHYSVKAELFLFGWLAFLPMGWFYRYKLNQYNIKESMLYGLLYLFLQLIYLSIVSLVLFLIVNPEAELASIGDTDTSVTAIMTTYIYFSWLGFIITGFTLGFFLFFVGYKFYFNQIYNTTPLSEITN